MYLVYANGIDPTIPLACQQTGILVSVWCNHKPVSIRIMTTSSKSKHFSNQEVRVQVQCNELIMTIPLTGVATNPPGCEEVSAKSVIYVIKALRWLGFSTNT